MSLRRTKVQDFRAALGARDPFVLQRVLKLPPIAVDKQASPPTRASSEQQVRVNGTDWSTVVSAWLDASQAAEAVSLPACFVDSNC